VSRLPAVTDDIALRFLFLPVLRCFSSRRSPLREAIAVGIPIRRSPVLRLRAASRSLSQLGTSFVGFRAEPFTRRHSSHCSDSVNESSGRLDRTYTRCHTHASVRGSACIDPSHPRSHGMVHRFAVPGSNALHHLRCTTSFRGREMDPLGFEPRASALQRRRSAAELWARPRVLALVVLRCSIGQSSVSSASCVGRGLRLGPGLWR
jgi:hypothetical protein